MDDELVSQVARALGHPARIRILRLLAEQEACMGGEIFAEFPLAQSTISQHLAVLKDAGLISATPHGTRMLYCIAEEPLAGLADALGEMISTRPVCTGKDTER